MTLFDSSTVSLLGLSARGYHGVLPVEREEGQLFTADVILSVDSKRLAHAASTDDLAQTVDYSQVARAVVAVIEGEPVNLIETLAERIAQAVLVFDGVRAVRVCIHKPQAPLDVAFDDVVITIDRDASDRVREFNGDPNVSMEVGQNWPSLRSGELAKSAVFAGLADAPDVRLPEPADESDDLMAPSWPSLRSGDVAKSVVTTGLAEAPGVGVDTSLLAASAAAAAGALASRPEPDASFEGAPCWPSAQSADVTGASMDDVMTQYTDENQANEAVDELAQESVITAPTLVDDKPVTSSQISDPDQEVQPAEEPAQDYYEMAPHWPSVRSGELAKSAVSAAMAEAPDVRLPEPADEDDPYGPMAPSWPSLRDGALAQSAVNSSMAPAPDLGVSVGAGVMAAGLAFRPQPDESVEAAPCWPSLSSAADPAAASRIAHGENTDESCEFHSSQENDPADQEDSPSGSEAHPFDEQPQEEQVVFPPAVSTAVDEVPVSVLDERPARPTHVVLALGGNIGDVLATLRHAVDELSDTTGIEVLSVAPLARTQAVTAPGSPEQPDFLNTVVVALTALSPREVLDVCHRLEDAAGRTREEKWGPRTLDIDLVTYDGVTSQDPELILPHPQAQQRAFVLLPWSHVDPFAELNGSSVADLAEEAPDRDGIRWLALEWKNSDALPAKPAGHYEIGHESV
ncbi:2-amino-4-hydroxy-6-hydroxymethyldihydropteridine diphosphokinase [Actinomyces vulturis]|uniref:2-amino-4-hydroxy-6- hydroxymethyldihydropteridine diphosphokinase n=1 Tax=Actinomyces vulturis TaxID=1857645 RepID=UPI0008349CE4|nr:2-amino-4-hydroxy-6-hydroxymethyldihydropteridine diphosphokinase [Actinomyces vulturis]